jgi:hypothetical protein
MLLIIAIPRAGLKAPVLELATLATFERTMSRGVRN